ncbi:hypothetical protein [uncultured Shewanella sp.]|uniref:hypothetical protein n=1 Tax=uncultured Shewanella sp. TaxID=173975 RepID=UPI0026054F5A|nr:hypothetical protein [uncultured Shewanella sp.]
MKTDDIFDWYWQPPRDLNSAPILKRTQDCIALASIKHTTQDQCKHIENQHQSYVRKLQQAVDNINKQ